MMRLLKSVALVTVVAAPPAAAQQPAEQAVPAKVRLFIPFKDYSAEENQRARNVADELDEFGAWRGQHGVQLLFCLNVINHEMER